MVLMITTHLNDQGVHVCIQALQKPAKRPNPLKGGQLRSLLTVAHIQAFGGESSPNRLGDDYPPKA